MAQVFIIVEVHAVKKWSALELGRWRRLPPARCMRNSQILIPYWLKLEDSEDIRR